MSWIVKVGVEPSMTKEEKDNNAIEFYNFFGTRNAGYTLECISAMLGNIHAESKVNPGCMETGQWYGDTSGVGLVQWTDGYILRDWCDLHGWDWYDGYAQCEKLAEELEMPTAGQWYPTSQYPYSQEQFRQMTDIDLAVKSFIYEYLRPAEWAVVQSLQERLSMAHYYYELLTGHQPIPPTPPTPIIPTKSKMKLMYYLKPFYKR